MAEAIHKHINESRHVPSAPIHIKTHYILSSAAIQKLMQQLFETRIGKLHYPEQELSVQRMQL